MAMNREESSTPTAAPAPAEHAVLDTRETTCCVVGGGPAGVVLSYLLARSNIPVTLLEMHGNFDRDFRGDTLHPSTLEIMDEVGLADQLLELPHTRMSRMTAQTWKGPVPIADLSRIKSKFPYVAMMPQARFLDFLTTQATRYPSFCLVMGAHVQELLEEQGVVRGVRYQAHDGWHAVRGQLTVGTDGRFSMLRKLAGLKAIKTSPPMDVLWFRLARRADDPHGLMGRFGRGHFLVELDRGEQWQIGLIIPKGTYQQLHAAGLEGLQKTIVDTAPEFADRVQELKDWKQVSLLSVEADRLPVWHKPGLLLIGDAAHVMSPAGGNGINYAIQDAVAAANILTAPLQAGKVSDADLARVQRRREWPTRVIQAFVNVVQERGVKSALDPNRTLTVPGIVHWPLVRDLFARLVAFGISREHVQTNPHGT